MNVGRDGLCFRSFENGREKELPNRLEKKIELQIALSLLNLVFKPNSRVEWILPHHEQTPAKPPLLVKLSQACRFEREGCEESQCPSLLVCRLGIESRKARQKHQKHVSVKYQKACLEFSETNCSTNPEVLHKFPVGKAE